MRRHAARTRSLLQTRAHRPPLPLQVRPGLKHQEALNHASELLKCACATAYESADQLRGVPRDMAMAVVHMVGMARALVDSALDAEEVRLKTTEGK
ncbi:DUF6124 family protein [Pseudomonas sp. KNUC1026]|uniref:DUF6124 family protein n=1 Tax=Pseudomonas sp. KNUC1026 TaxID=2893890 RepID=UPI001F2278AE|nr:DUF3077 domain-containing protein [Pseudomonas sp. KNUC1026]UFH50700.1 DUF3077 domain-containing protein [Pseudomonas sp. KNUC1026]